MSKRHLVVAASIAFTLMLVSSSDSKPRKQQQTTGPTVLILDTDTRIDINNLEMFVYNDGNFAYDKDNVEGKTDGLYYPRGTKKTVVYSAGVWIGAKVNGSPRLAVAEYSSEYGPGPMAGGTFLPDSPSYRCYKIHKGDTENSNPDYANWPVSQGAPVDGLGKPAVLGNQMIWSVFNDADPTGHMNGAASTQPLGIEIQQSVFAFARQGVLGNTCYLRYKIINKGSNNLQETYVSIWADPDLGDASDDLVGCDTILSLGYCYNHGSDNTYGAAPPAVGFALLQGPIVPGTPSDSALIMGHWRTGHRNLPMTVFMKYINGTDPGSAVETYGYMRGLQRTAPGIMEDLIDPTTQEVTTFAVPGDPVTNSGWVDEAASDRRLMLSSGPFNMSPGDTQEVIVGVLVAQSSSALNSVAALRSSAEAVAQVLASTIQANPPFVCGDVNFSGTVDLADVMYIANYIFSGGPVPADTHCADANCDGRFSITDCVFLVSYLYQGAGSPCANCGGN